MQGGFIERLVSWIDPSLNTGAGFTQQAGVLLRNRPGVTSFDTTYNLNSGRLEMYDGTVIMQGSPFFLGGAGGVGEIFLAGGTLDLNGNALILSNAPSSQSVVNIVSGVLDMGGNSIFVGSGSTAISFTGGTLKNVFQIGDLLKPFALSQSGGTLAPGNSAGITTILGDYTLSNTASLEIEIISNGGVAGADHDQLVVTGNAILQGELDVVLVNSFIPTASDIFIVVQSDSLIGSFSNAVSTISVGGGTFDVNYFSDQVILTNFQINVLAGDTDNDGDIDDADLGTSFSNFTGPVGAAGGKTAADGDTDVDGDVDDADLANSFSGFTGPLGPITVPEPASVILLGIGGMLLARRRRAA